MLLLPMGSNDLIGAALMARWQTRSFPARSGSLSLLQGVFVSRSRGLGYSYETSLPVIFWH